LLLLAVYALRAREVVALRPQATRIYAKVDLTALRLVGDFSLEGLL
jgi:hypothetical protein